MLLLLKFLLLLQQFNTALAVETFDWSAQISGSLIDVAKSVTTDSQDNIIVIGDQQSTTLNFFDLNGAQSSVSLSNDGGVDVFIGKYNSTGSLIWAARVGGSGSEYGYFVTVDNLDNIYVSGYYASKPLNIYDSSGVSAYSITNQGASDGFLVKYSSSGAFVWATRVGGTGNDYIYSISVDSTYNVLISGYFTSATMRIYDSANAQQTTLSTSGSSDGFIVKYSSNGLYLLSIRIGGSSYDGVYVASFDSQGNIIGFGDFGSSPLTLYNSGGASAKTLTNKGSGTYDNFIAKYSSAGVLSWAAQIGGSAGESAYSMVVDSQDRIIVHGEYSSSPLSIYNQNGVAAKTLANRGSTDVYVAKYNADGTLAWAVGIGGTAVESAYCVSVDSLDNVLVVSTYASSPVSIYDSTDAQATTISSIGGTDAFAVKYNSSGYFVLAFKFGGSGTDSLYSIAADSKNSIIVGGQYQSNPFNIYNSSGSVVKTYSNNQQADAFIAKFSQPKVLSIITTTTVPPTTVAPTTTVPPTTVAPTTTVTPTTVAPTTTVTPTTVAPTTTVPPTTVAPTTTVTPTTVTPTSSTIVASTTDIIATSIATTLTSGVDTTLQTSVTIISTASNIAPIDTTTVFTATLTVSSNIMTSTLSYSWSITSNPSSFITTANTQQGTTQQISQNTVEIISSQDSGQQSSLTQSIVSDQSSSSQFTSSTSISKLDQLTADTIINTATSDQSSNNLQSSQDTLLSQISKSSSQLSTILFTFSSQSYSFNQKSSSTSDSQQEFNNNTTGDSISSFISGNILYVVLVLAFVVLCTLVVLLTYFYKRIKKRNDLLNFSKSTTVLQTTDEMISKTTIGNMTTSSFSNTTVNVTQTPLSVPGFLQFRYGFDYRSEAHIASGGLSQVYKCLALSPKLKQIVGRTEIIVKVIEISNQTQFERQKVSFYQEISMYYRFQNYPNFPKMYAYSENPFSVVLKYYSHGSLLNLLLGKTQDLNAKYNVRMVTSLLKQFSNAIKTMHDLGFVHLDIKPDNVLLDIDAKGQLIPIVTDFGISKLFDETQNKVKSFQLSKLDGLTLVYASPEKIFNYKNKFYDVEPELLTMCDVYSISILMFEVLTRTKVWM